MGPLWTMTKLSPWGGEVTLPVGGHRVDLGTQAAGRPWVRALEPLWLTRLVQMLRPQPRRSPEVVRLCGAGDQRGSAPQQDGLSS